MKEEGERAEDKDDKKIGYFFKIVDMQRIE